MSEASETPSGRNEPEPGPQAEAPDELPEVDEETRERRRAALELVRRFGDPVLKSPASPIREFGPELRSEADRMVELMHDALGVGLAATQLGVMRRMLVFQAGPDATPRAIVNPELEWTSDELATSEEGCLSLPGVIVDVERPLYARVSGVDTAGERMLIEAAGLEARVLQHEIDHLDGVLILDRTVREQRRGALRALREGGAFSPEMLDPPAEDEDEPDAAAGVPAREADAEPTSGR